MLLYSSSDCTFALLNTSGHEKQGRCDPEHRTLCGCHSKMRRSVMRKTPMTAKSKSRKPPSPKHANRTASRNASADVPTSYTRSAAGFMASLWTTGSERKTRLSEANGGSKQRRLQSSTSNLQKRARSNNSTFNWTLNGRRLLSGHYFSSFSLHQWAGEAKMELSFTNLEQHFQSKLDLPSRCGCIGPCDRLG
jgi:hypothetical protein